MADIGNTIQIYVCLSGHLRYTQVDDAVIPILKIHALIAWFTQVA